MTLAISVENLSKRYNIGQIGTGTFANDMKVWWAKARSKPNPLLKVGETDHGNREDEEIWALKDISFKVGQGEVLGIIGRNGAGKSTLLKILSRVTAPTSGKIKVKGRVASLLEVGTGFHPELTGRENVYLNGAILGMDRQEVARKFDEIVDFSGVGKFIDTPVKRYSSGMHVRLGFAVAAHLDPEILVVDEVLAVGDAEFQKKCLGKMEDVAKEGRTVLFVSHNMASILSLCDRGLLLDQGCVLGNGLIESIVDQYLKIGATQFEVLLTERADRSGDGIVRITDCRIHRILDQAPVTEVFVNDQMYICLTMEASKKTNIWLGVGVMDMYDNKMAYFGNRLQGLPPSVVNGKTKIIVYIPKLMLLEGKYSLEIGIVNSDNMKTTDSIKRAAEFSILPKDIYGSGFAVGARFGKFHMPFEWIVKDNVDFI